MSILNGVAGVLAAAAPDNVSILIDSSAGIVEVAVGGGLAHSWSWLLFGPADSYEVMLGSDGADDPAGGSSPVDTWLNTGSDHFWNWSDNLVAFSSTLHIRFAGSSVDLDSKPVTITIG